jgi:hypothetical protein
MVLAFSKVQRTAIDYKYLGALHLLPENYSF